MAYAPVYTPEPTRPYGGPRPGTLTIARWTIDHWDDADAHDDTDPVFLGIYNPRDVCGNPWPRWRCPGSQHARGAAWDTGFPKDRARWPNGHPEGWKYARWLVANHLELGVQEGIWAGQRWTNQTLEWRDYGGRSDHFDHVHAAQHATAAAFLTLGQILAVAPRPPAPKPMTRPPKDGPMFTYDGHHPNDPTVVILVLVAAGKRVRLTGETLGAHTRGLPTHIGQVGPDEEGRFEAAWGPVIL